MIDYPYYIRQSSLTIYDDIDPTDDRLYIPTCALEVILRDSLVGLSLSGLALRTRSKVVKSAICEALGYPIPRSFAKTQPRFPGQNFDVYTQKSMNVQIWNEEVDGNRRYVFLRVSKDDVINAVKVICGEELVQYDRTGTLTRKYQATMNSYGHDICSSNDSPTISNWIVDSPTIIIESDPNLSLIHI